MPVEYSLKGKICECGKKSFTKNQADSFMKGKIMSRKTKKKVHIYQCDISFVWHLSTVKDSTLYAKRKTHFNNRRRRQYW